MEAKELSWVKSQMKREIPSERDQVSRCLDKASGGFYWWLVIGHMNIPSPVLPPDIKELIMKEEAVRDRVGR